MGRNPRPPSLRSENNKSKSFPCHLQQFLTMCVPPKDGLKYDTLVISHNHGTDEDWQTPTHTAHRTVHNRQHSLRRSFASNLGEGSQWQQDVATLQWSKDWRSFLYSNTTAICPPHNRVHISILFCKLLRENRLSRVHNHLEYSSKHAKLLIHHTKGLQTQIIASHTLVRNQYQT
jgi:hypothetical protein